MDEQSTMFIRKYSVVKHNVKAYESKRLHMLWENIVTPRHPLYNFRLEHGFINNMTMDIKR